MEKRGTVKLFNKRKGYGIVQSENRDYFFRYTDIVTTSHKHCEQGQQVQFIPQQSIRGLRAVQVQAM